MSRITPDQSEQLDSIRALSAFVVLLGHTNQSLLLPTLKSGSTYVGFFTQLSVMVFFVLSGFLIGKSVCNNTSKHGEFKIGQYARDRALRLYPPLITALILMIALAALAPYLFPSGSHSLISIPGVRFVRTEFAVVAKDLWGALAFLNEFKTTTPTVNGPLWSLSLEAWYYVIAAALFVWPTKKVVALILFAVTLLVTHKNQLFFMLAPIWFAGFGLAFIHQRRPEMNNSMFGGLFAILSVGVIVCVALVLFADPLGRGIWLDRMNHFRLISGLWFACFLALILGGAARFPKFLHGHAGYSYTLYVIHFPIMLFILGLSQTFIYGSVPKSLLVSAGTLIVSTLVARLLARWVENKNFIHAAASSAKQMVTAK